MLSFFTVCSVGQESLYLNVLNILPRTEGAIIWESGGPCRYYQNTDNNRNKSVYL